MITTCPTRDELDHLLLGKLPPEQAATLSEHLEACQQCQAEVGTIDSPGDTLLSAIHHSDVPATFEAESALARAIEQIKQFGLPPLNRDGSTEVPQDLGTIRDYRLLAKLGQGGMGTVHKALHMQLDRIVALKLLPVDRMHAEAIARFQREMKAVGKLHHPHIVQAFDAGEHEGRYYLAMELVDGADLAAVVRQHGWLPIADACEVARQTALALEYVRQHGMVHRDIKPSNLVLNLAGQVKVLDLGLARLHDPAHEGEELTSASQAMGTADYLAPEQVGDSHGVDIRADLYGLGCTLYKLLTGDAPYADYRSPAQKMVAHLSKPFPDVRSRRPEVPPALKAVLDCLVAKEQSDRYATPVEVAAALLPFCAGHDLPALATAKLDDGPGSALTVGSTSDAPSLDETLDPARRASEGPALPEMTAPPRKDRVFLAGASGWLGNRNLLISLAAGGLALVLGIVVLIQTRSGTLLLTVEGPQDGTQPVIKVDGEEAKVTLGKDGKTYRIRVKPGSKHTLLVTTPDGTEFGVQNEFSISPGQETKLTARLAEGPIDAADPDRRAAEWVLSIGGAVSIKENGKERPVGAVGDLPLGAFELTVVTLGETSTVDDEGLAIFKGCKKLKRLTLRHERVSNAGLAHFKECKDLAQLSLGGSKMSDAGVSHFKDCKDLTHLTLSYTKVSDLGLAHFKDCTNLTSLDLSGTPVSDAGLAHFNVCRGLSNVRLYATQVTGTGLAHFKNCQNLASLTLSHTPVTDAGLARLKDCTNLMSLDLMGIQLRDGGLAHLKDCKNLISLHLEGTNASDAGLDHLQDCKNLANVNLKSTKVTAAGIDELKKALPLCQIKWDGGVIERRTASPLDALDPEQIPLAERFPWQPKELAAVIGEHRQRHWGAVMSLAMRPDGKQVASGGYDGKIRFWDNSTRQEAVDLQIAAYANVLAWSPDGKRFAIASSAGSVELWDVSRAKAKRQMVIPDSATSYPWTLAVSSDGKALVYDVSGDEKRNGIWLWDVSQGEPQLRERYPSAGAATLSPDGKSLAIVFKEEPTVRIFDLTEATPKQRAVLPGAEGKVRLGAVVHPALFLPDGRLATHDPESGVWLWDVSGKVPNRQSGLKLPEVARIAFSADGERMATATNSNVQLWAKEGPSYAPMPDLATKLEAAGALGPLAISPDGTTLVTGHAGGTVRFWRVMDDSLVEQNPVKPQTYAGVGFFPVVLPEGPALAATAEDLQVRAWRFGGATPAEAPFLGNWPPKGRVLAGTRDGKALATGYEANSVQLWHADGTKFREIFKAPKLFTGLAALSDDGLTLATAIGHQIALWDMRGAAPKETSTVVGGQGHIQSLTFSPDGRTLFSAADNIVRLWTVADGKLTEQTQIDPVAFTSLAVSPDGKMLAIANYGGVRFWDLTGDKPRKGTTVVAGDHAHTVAFSPDSRTLAVAGATPQLSILEVATGRELHKWSLPGAVLWAAYAPDGRHLFTANSNGTIYVLRLEPTSAAPVAADPDRRAAEWVLSIDSAIRIKEQSEEREVKAVGDLPTGAFELTVADLYLNPQVNDAGLAHFKDCKNLTYLTLGGSQVSNAGFAHFKACTNLKHLALYNETRVDDAGLALLKDCKNLTSLILSGAQVSNAGLAHFKDCSNLWILDVRDTKVSDEGLTYFQGCRNLLRLYLSGTKVTDDGLAHLKDCAHLQIIDLRDTAVGGAGLIAIKDCKQLNYLDLGNTQVGDDGLANITGFSKLAFLNVKNCQVTEAAVKKVAVALPECRIEWDGGVIELTADPDRRAAEYVLSIGGGMKIEHKGEEREIKAVGELPPEAFELTTVDLTANEQLTDEGLANFKGCQNLLDLSLAQTKLTDAGLVYFQNCKKLTHLWLGSTKLTDVGLAHFKDCKNLKRLWIGATYLTDAGLVHFQNCKDLEDLSLMNTWVTDAGLANFKNSQSYTHLWLEGTKVGDTGLAHFKPGKKMNELHLAGTRASDAFLAQLSDATELAYIDLTKTKVSESGVKKLAAMLPGCRIEWEGGVIEPTESAE